MSLLTLAYPVLSARDYKLIQQHRKESDALYYSVVEPHFTFVFGTEDISTDLFIEEIIDKSADTHTINFSISQATINKDPLSEYFYAFLIPDRGMEDIILLHDKLYSEHLRHHLRSDIPYTPHITIGNSKDQSTCERMVDVWNQKGILVHGQISSLTIIEYQKKIVYPLYEISLS